MANYFSLSGRFPLHYKPLKNIFVLVSSSLSLTKNICPTFFLLKHNTSFFLLLGQQAAAFRGWGDKSPARCYWYKKRKQKKSSLLLFFFSLSYVCLSVCLPALDEMLRLLFSSNSNSLGFQPKKPWETMMLNSKYSKFHQIILYS